MCGRFSFNKKHNKELAARFKLKEIPENLVGNSNLSPGQNVPAILNTSPGKLSLLRWGLIPSWAKEEAIGFKTFNARAETIIEKPAFKESIRKRRCLILADGFYDWKKTEKGKQPYHITLKDKSLFAFAGIWDIWKSSQGEVASCSIITTAPNALIAPIHDRMPVILPSSKEKRWLGDMLLEEIISLLKSYPEEGMEASAIRVSRGSLAHKEILLF